MGLRILLVDDEPDARDSLGEILDALGHDVRTASDGPSALAQAAAFRPEVVLLDIELPGLDGYEVARRLRAHAATRHARLIALTGYARDDDRRIAARAGFDHHLPKPVRVGVLTALLAEPGGRSDSR